MYKTISFKKKIMATTMAMVTTLRGLTPAWAARLTT